MSGPTHVYVLVLDDPTGAVIAVPAAHVVIKVGMSNDPSRRLSQLNVGFPHGSRIRWVLDHSNSHPSGEAAFAAESDCLERLRRDRQWIGGEFAIVPKEIVRGLI